MGLERLAPVLGVVIAVAAAGCGLGGEAAVPAASDAAGLVGVEQTTVVRRGDTVGTIRATGVENLAAGWRRLRTRWTRFGTIPAGRGQQLGVDEVLYVSVPPTLRPGKRWLAWTSDDDRDGPGPIGSLGVFLVPDDPVQAKGPAGALDALDALGAVPQLLGRGRLQGVETTHYRGTATDVPWGRSAVDVEVELWIDADGFARRLVTTTRRLDAKVTTTTDYQPNAEPQPRPAAPPARAVLDVNALSS